MKQGKQLLKQQEKRDYTTLNHLMLNLLLKKLVE